MICSLHFKPKADVEGGELLPGQWQEGKYFSKKPYALLSNFPGKWLIDPTITSLTAKKRFDFPEPARKTKRPQSCVVQDEPVPEDDRPLTATFSSLNIGQQNDVHLETLILIVAKILPSKRICLVLLFSMILMFLF